MPSGGARARSGPVPDPDALRRDRPSDIAGWTTLPAEGRVGLPPAWPLEVPATSEQWVEWVKFWTKPQAIVWERDQIFEPVAMFVMQYLEAMVPKASAENRKTVRMMFADLYLTSDSLARAKLRIAADEVAAKRAAAPPDLGGPSVRQRLKAINGAAGA